MVILVHALVYAHIGQIRNLKEQLSFFLFIFYDSSVSKLEHIKQLSMFLDF